MSLAAQHRHTADDRERDEGGRVPVLVPRALDLLAEHGPMRQADLRKLLDVQSSVMATVVVPGLRDAGVDFGEPVDRSPVLSLDGDERPFESAPSGDVEEPEVEEPVPFPLADVPPPNLIPPSEEIEPERAGSLISPGSSTSIGIDPLHQAYIDLLSGLLDTTEGEARERLRERYVTRLSYFAADAETIETTEHFLDLIERELGLPPD